MARTVTVSATAEINSSFDQSKQASKEMLRASRAKINPTLPIFMFSKSPTRKMALFAHQVLHFLFCYYVIRSAYTWVMDTFHPTEFHLTITCTMVVHQLTFWSLNLVLTLVDLWQKPKWLYDYKIQQVSVGWKEHKKCILNVLFNQHFVLFPFVGLMFPAFQVNCYRYLLWTIFLVLPGISISRASVAQYCCAAFLWDCHYWRSFVLL